MTWAFLVIRDNAVANIKGFSDYWEASKFADSYIKNNLGVDIETYPAYNKGENYSKENISVGVYLVSLQKDL